MIEIEVSYLPQAEVEGGSLCLTSGKRKWHKFYGSRSEALREARILKLTNSALARIDRVDASGNEPAPTCIVEYEMLVDLKFCEG